MCGRDLSFDREFDLEDIYLAMGMMDEMDENEEDEFNRDFDDDIDEE